MIDLKTPENMRRADGTRKYAFVTFIMMNDSFLPGGLMTAYGLKKKKLLTLGKHDDFQLWYKDFSEMVTAYPQLYKFKKIQVLMVEIFTNFKPNWANISPWTSSAR
jgi:hypothetical protein